MEQLDSWGFLEHMDLPVEELDSLGFLEHMGQLVELDS